MESFFNTSIVSAVIFAPLLGALLLGFIPSTEKGQLKVATLATMIVTFLLSLWLYASFEVATPHPQFQFELKKMWMESLGISYHVGVDGVAVTLMLLTGFLGPIVVLAAWNNAGERAKEFCLALLAMQTSMMGTFAALDLVLFFVFWEGVLIPMYLLIGVFGSSDRVAAAVKFFLYTMFGSMLMLVAMLYLYAKTGAAGGGGYSFDYTAMAQVGAKLTLSEQGWLFFAFALAFAIKVPMWPVHTWLPDAHTEAPAAGSMVLAGVMLKMGTFGFMRYAMPLFPQAALHAAPILGVLATIGIVYGSLMCMVQRDMKRLVAYSSVAHLGFVMLGLAALSPQAATGAVYQMVNHGISTGALFLLIGAIYERQHTRKISDFGGLAKIAPLMSVAFLVITFSSIGLPGTNGFVGEFLILSGTFVSGFVSQNTLFDGHPAAWATLSAISTTGVILGAAYMLYLVQRVWFGPAGNPRNDHMPDLNVRELFAVVPLVLTAVLMGIFPQPFIDRIKPVSNEYATRVIAPERAQMARAAEEAPGVPPVPGMPGAPGTPGMPPGMIRMMPANPGGSTVPVQQPPRPVILPPNVRPLMPPGGVRKNP